MPTQNYIIICHKAYILMCHQATPSQTSIGNSKIINNFDHHQYYGEHCIIDIITWKEPSNLCNPLISKSELWNDIINAYLFELLFRSEQCNSEPINKFSKLGKCQWKIQLSYYNNINTRIFLSVKCRRFGVFFCCWPEESLGLYMIMLHHLIVIWTRNALEIYRLRDEYCLALCRCTQIANLLL